MGGKLDATNVFPRPCVTCVTTLDYDHMHVLGHTITEIAREVHLCSCNSLRPQCSVTVNESHLVMPAESGDIQAGCACSVLTASP